MNHTTLRILVGLALFVIAFNRLHAATTTLINFGGPWRYNDFGSYPGSTWFTQGYSDSSWLFNFAEFGYGDNDEQTELSPVTTAYFRWFFTISNINAFSSFTMRILRDDGVAVYVNGTEVLRQNLPEGTLQYTTRAVTNLSAPQETIQVVADLPASTFSQGVNLIAVEVHQATGTVDPDLSFNLQLVGNQNTNPPPLASVVRGPYLQVGTSSNIIVRWRTDAPADTMVRYGTNAAALNLGVTNSAMVTDHEITLTRLLPDTKYFYAIGVSTQLLAGNNSYYFVTAPAPGVAKPTRIWAIGDFGTGFGAQAAVRDAYVNFTGTRHTDAWLFLGDNAYGSGFDNEYQSYVFEIYPNELRRMVVWPTVGNHETGQSQALTDDYDYYRIFTMPTNGSAGGVPSGTEHFYSYDYANIHFIVLDSMTAIYRQPDSAMAQWLKADLADTTKDWIIAYFHHPPYTRGSHTSDLEGDLIEMRANINPILEDGGVDLVLSGHSHCFERSYLIDGFYGHSSTVNSNHFVNHDDGKTNGGGAYLKPGGGLGAGRGTVYIVDGSSGGQGGGGSLDHPAMFYSVLTPGSLVIDIDGLRLDGTFVSSSGTVDDTFTILKNDYPGAPRPAMSISRAGTNAVITWPTSVPDYRLEFKPSFPPVATAWTPVTSGVSTNGRRKVAAVPNRLTNEFFQLRKGP